MYKGYALFSPFSPLRSLSISVRSTTTTNQSNYPRVFYFYLSTISNRQPRGRGDDQGGGRAISRESSRDRGRSMSREPSDHGGGYGGGPPRGHGGPPIRARGSSGGGPRGGFRGDAPPSGPYTQTGGHEVRLSTQEEQDLVSLLSRVQISSSPASSSSPYAVRPGFGTKGRPTKLYANFFVLRYPKKLVLYDYVIDIEPDVKKNARERERVFEALEMSPEFRPYVDNIVHDGTQRLITDQEMPDGLVIGVRVEESRGSNQSPKVTTYKVKFPEYNTLDTADLDRYLQADPAYASYNIQPIISAFQLISTFNASKSGTRFGRNKYYFSPETFNEGQQYLQPGLDAWKGFFTSVRPVYKQLMVNINVCMSPFYSPMDNLVNAWNEFQKLSRDAGSPPFDIFQRVKVTMTYLGYKKTSAVKGFGKPANQERFDCPEFGGQMTVAEYFRKKYKIQLRSPDAPLVNIGPRADKNKNIWIPMELCAIEKGQPYRGLLTENGTTQMIRCAYNPPSNNANTIVKQGLPTLGYDGQGGVLASLNMTINNNMTVIPARILDPPRIVYGNGQPRIQNGGWNVLGVKFKKPASIVGISVLVIKGQSCDDSDFTGYTDPVLRQVVQGFLDRCRACGMQVDSQMPQVRIVKNFPHPRDDHLRKGALGIIKEAILSFSSKPTLILVLMPNRDNDLYPGLKKLCDVELGVPTVCMLSGKVKKAHRQDQYFSNIALKVNTKLKGINHVLDESYTRWLKDTMLVGMDVTHPSPGMVKGFPSIAAVVASCDETFMQYPASMRIQRPDPKKMSKEEIDELKEMMVERLAAYQEKKGKLPQRIIVFRDGVSEHQYDMVLRKELPRIKASFRSFQGYSPKVTLVICTRRHHFRNFVQNPNDGDRTGNTPAGTVVDQGITSVYGFDFYLQPHACLQGTVRSTRYTILHDENKYGADDMQVGTNSLSYMLARATKGVSLIPPVYWADTACKRGRCYLREAFSANGLGKMSEDQIWQLSKQVWGQGVHDSLKDTMYYL